MRCTYAYRTGALRREALRRDVLAAIEHCRDHRGVYRFRIDHRFVVACKPR